MANRDFMGIQWQINPGLANLV
uniref:Uncharacterized protein n=1 Tax=Anguilla anguilla TaxID=7936 RepID=A0A0E9PKS7_ANGAN